MNNQNRNIKGVLLTGALLAGAVLGTPKAISAENLFNFGSLGSGAELRSALLNSSPNRNLEMKCGNKHSSKTKAADAKSKDAKCGEGKCGDKKDSSKVKDAKCGEKKMESKTKDAKCGEGKCGDKKTDAKKDAKPAEKK